MSQEAGAKALRQTPTVAEFLAAFGVSEDPVNRSHEHGYFIDRLTWAGLTSAQQLDVLKELYHGRAGMKACWWDSEVAEWNTDWTAPLTALGVNTNEPEVPFRNAIHLRNSQDGVNLDRIYLTAKVMPNDRWVLRFDLRCPLLADLPVGTDSICAGFEVPFQGGTTIYMLHIEKTQVTLLARLLRTDGTMEIQQSADISAWIATGNWRGVDLILDPPFFRITNLTNTAEIRFSDNVNVFPKVTPFFANEASVIVGGIYVGQWAAWHIVPQNPVVRNALDRRVNSRQLPYGMQFTERWNEGFFDKNLFMGRSGAYYQSEAIERDLRNWHTPPFETGVNVFELPPFDNAIQLTNTIDGVTPDPMYVGIPRQYKAAVFTFQARLPTLAEVTASDWIYVGFEKTSSSATCIACLIANNGVYYLMCTFMGVGDSSRRATAAIALPNLNAWSFYSLVLTPTGLRLFEWNWGIPFWISRAYLEFPDRIAIDWMSPFLANEGTASILSNFHIGEILIQALEPNPVECSLQTDKDTHFTGAIVLNAKEDENITNLLSNKVKITDIVIEADENLHFKLLFWATDAFDDANLDVDSFLGSVDLDIPTNGVRIGGAGQYYLDVYNLGLHYRDDDYTNELHISLQCLSAAGKTAGANGEVVVKIGYKLEE